MWVAKIRLRHDCIIGNRCKKFKVTLQSYDLNEESKGNKVLTSSIHQILGEKQNIFRFINDLKKDKDLKHMEINENTLFLIESSKNKPVSRFSKRMFFVKPVVIDANGYEHWEVASHQKADITNFIRKTRPICHEFELHSIKNTKLKDIYFPKVLPNLTDLQKKALQLAILEGYYEAPKRTSLRALAKIMGISLATFQKHLQRAETKVMPDILSYLK